MDYRVKLAIAFGVGAFNWMLISKESSRKRKQREKVVKDAVNAIDEIMTEAHKRKLVYRDIYGNEKYTWIVSDDVK